MSLFRRTTAIVALLAYLAISTVGAGWVLCIGANGHTAIESLTAGCCVTAEAITEREDSHLFEDRGCESQRCETPDASGDAHEHDDCPAGDDCGDCRDVALSDLALSRLPSSDDFPKLPAALPLIGAARVFAAPTPRRVLRHPDRSPRPPPRHAEIACTILRL